MNSLRKLKLFSHTLFLAALLLAAPGSSHAGDMDRFDAGVADFIRLFEEGGLNDLEMGVIMSYKRYDLRPSEGELQEVLGRDMAAYIFYTDYIPKSRRGIPHYDLWSQEAMIARTQRRLADFYSEPDTAIAIAKKCLDRAERKVVEYVRKK